MNLASSKFSPSAETAIVTSSGAVTFESPKNHAFSSEISCTSFQVNVMVGEEFNKWSFQFVQRSSPLFTTSFTPLTIDKRLSAGLPQLSFKVAYSGATFLGSTVIVSATRTVAFTGIVSPSSTAAVPSTVTISPTFCNCSAVSASQVTGYAPYVLPSGRKPVVVSGSIGTIPAIVARE